MNANSISGKAKSIIAIFVLLLVLVLFILAIVWALGPIDEAQRETRPAPVVPQEVTPPALPQTGVSQ